MLTILLIVLVIAALGGSGWGYSRYGVGGGIGPVGLFLVVLAVLYLSGNLNGVRL